MEIQEEFYLQKTEQETVEFYEPTIGVIGLGNMGLPLVQGLLKSGYASTGRIVVCNRTEQSTLKLLEEGNVASEEVVVAKDNSEVVLSSDIVFLVMKPGQVLGELHSWRKQRLDLSNRLVVSCAAGIKIEEMSSALGNTEQAIARVMPNRAVALREGISGWYINEHASVGQENQLRDILLGLGAVMQLRDEALMPAFTSIFGSGQGVHCGYMEGVYVSAVELGLPQEGLKEMILASVLGTVLHVKASGGDFVAERLRVTSPNGTTDAIMKKLNALRFGRILTKGFRAGAERGKELGEQHKAENNYD